MSRQFFKPGNPDTGPTYASKRPAVMAPTQQSNDSQARPLAVPETGAISNCGSANTFFRMILRTAIPEKTNTIFTQKSGFVPLVVASAINREVPVIRLRPNPHHIHGYRRSIGFRGI